MHHPAVVALPILRMGLPTFWVNEEHPGILYRAAAGSLLPSRRLLLQSVIVSATPEPTTVTVMSVTGTVTRHPASPEPGEGTCVPIDTMATADIGCHAAIERVYSSETFADGSARNSLTTAEIKRGVAIFFAPDVSWDFAFERAARHVGETGARTAPINHEDFVMGPSMFRPALIALVGTAALSGCYYDPATGLTYAYPPPPAYGYPQPPPPGAYGGPAPEYGAPPAAGYGAPPPAAQYGTPPAGGYGGPVAPGYGQPPTAGGDITRAQFVARAQQRAETHNRDPQRAAARAGTIFDQIDVNHTGIISRAQLRAWREAHRPPQGAGAPPPGQY